MTDALKTKPVIGQDDRLAQEKCPSEISLKSIIAQIDEIYEHLNEICAETDGENFCEDCPNIVIMGDVLEFWGASCLREYPSCEAEFDPEDRGCPRHVEYAALIREREKLEAELARLEALYEMAENMEGARAI